MEIETLPNEEKDHLNLIIPKLIGKSVIFTKAMKEKIKSNMIFNEFDHKASKDFHYYLNESNRRYKGLKCGGHLHNYLKDAQIHNRLKAKKIFSDEFYTKLNCDEDRAAMKINHNGPLLTEMNELIKKIKERSDISVKNNSIKNELIKKIELHKKRIRRSILLEKFPELENNKKYVYSSEKVLKATNLIKDIVEDDKEYFLNEMLNYSKSLKNIRDKIEKGEETKEKIEYNPDFRMLNYQKYIPVKIEKKVEIPVVNMHKIIPYSKLGKKRGQSTKEIKKTNIDFPFITSQSYDIIQYNYSNPYGIVKDMAYNEAFINERFDQKNIKVENKLHIDSLPHIDTYDKILKDKSERIKSVRKERNERIAKLQIESLIDKRDISRKKIENDVENKWDKLIEQLDNEKDIFE